MGTVLNMADELQAYTLSDRATYLARTLTGTTLEIMVEGDPLLFNPYGVMAVNPDKGEHIQNDLANQFIDWLISVETQEMIGQFGSKNLVRPCLRLIRLPGVKPTAPHQVKNPLPKQMMARLL